MIISNGSFKPSQTSTRSLPVILDSDSLGSS
jgi:hypothetical protein